MCSWWTADGWADSAGPVTAHCELDCARVAFSSYISLRISLRIRIEAQIESIVVFAFVGLVIAKIDPDEPLWSPRAMNWPLIIRADDKSPYRVRREKALDFSGCNSRPGTGSLHPVAIETGAEATTLSELSLERVARRLREHAGRNVRKR